MQNKELLKFNNKNANNQLNMDFFLKNVEPAAQQRKCTESKQACEKTFNIVCHWGMQIKTM